MRELFGAGNVIAKANVNQIEVPNIRSDRCRQARGSIAICGLSRLHGWGKHRRVDPQESSRGRRRAGVQAQLHSTRTQYATLPHRSEEHTSELQSLMRISYAVFCLKKKKKTNKRQHTNTK